ncbi:acyl-CoA synthetase family member 2, mitochondrial [Trichonephila clavipes]|nr:acyl-CoA synthetase family member 2, mitochondrial [Trichonephila clavipes]
MATAATREDKRGYIRNAGKEVKLFASALEALQCNNRIVMTQKTHLDDFLRCCIIGRLECERTQQEVSEELGICLSVIPRLWPRFEDDDTWKKRPEIPHQFTANYLGFLLTLTSPPLLRLASTSSSTIHQPANQVAPCSPSRNFPLPQATFTILVMGRRNAPRSMSQ